MHFTAFITSILLTACTLHAALSQYRKSPPSNAARRSLWAPSKPLPAPKPAMPDWLYLFCCCKK